MNRGILTIELSDPHLMAATIRDYVAEMQYASNHCYECDCDELCSNHERRFEEMKDNLAALAVGMSVIRVR